MHRLFTQPIIFLRRSLSLLLTLCLLTPSLGETFQAYNTSSPIQPGPSCITESDFSRQALLLALASADFRSSKFDPPASAHLYQDAHQRSSHATHTGTEVCGRQFLRLARCLKWNRIASFFGWERLPDPASVEAFDWIREFFAPRYELFPFLSEERGARFAVRVHKNDGFLSRRITRARRISRVTRLTFQKILAEALRTASQDIDSLHGSHIVYFTFHPFAMIRAVRGAIEKKIYWHHRYNHSRRGKGGYLTADRRAAEAVVSDLKSWIERRQVEYKSAFLYDAMFLHEFGQRPDLDEYIAGLVQLVFDPRKNICFAAINILQLLAEHRHFPNYLDMALERDKENTAGLINNLIDDLDRERDSSLLTLQTIGSIVVLPEHFFKKLAGILEIHGHQWKEQGFANTALLTFHQIIIPPLSDETQRLFLQVFFRSDLDVKSVLLRSLVWPLSRMQALVPELLVAACPAPMGSATNFNDYHSLFLQAFLGIAEHQSRFGNLPEAVLSSIVNILDEQTLPFLLDKAAITLGTVGLAYRRRNSEGFLQNLKLILEGRYGTASVSRKPWYGIALVEMGHSLCIDPKIRTEIYSQGFSVNQMVLNLRKAEPGAVLILNELPRNVGEERQLMGALSVSGLEIGLDIVSQEGSDKPFIIVRKGIEFALTMGINGSKVSEFKLHSHPPSHTMNHVEIIPSTLDVDYVQPEPLDEYLWAHGQLWHMEATRDQVHVKENEWLFKRENEEQRVPADDRWEQNNVLNSWLARNVSFSVYVNYGRRGVYKTTHEPDLTIKKAWKRTIQKRKRASRTNTTGLSIRLNEPLISCAIGLFFLIGVLRLASADVGISVNASGAGLIPYGAWLAVSAAAIAYGVQHWDDIIGFWKWKPTPGISSSA